MNWCCSCFSVLYKWVEEPKEEVDKCGIVMLEDGVFAHLPSCPICQARRRPSQIDSIALGRQSVRKTGTWPFACAGSCAELACPDQVLLDFFASDPTQTPTGPEANETGGGAVSDSFSNRYGEVPRAAWGSLEWFFGMCVYFIFVWFWSIVWGDVEVFFPVFFFIWFYWFPWFFMSFLFFCFSKAVKSQPHLVKGNVCLAVCTTASQRPPNRFPISLSKRTPPQKPTKTKWKHWDVLSKWIKKGTRLFRQSGFRGLYFLCERLGKIWAWCFSDGSFWQQTTFHLRGRKT